MKKRWLLLFAILLWWIPSAHAQQQTATQGLTITVNPPHQVVIKWTASVTSGISGYHVWRSPTSGSGYVQIATIGSGTTTYTDNSVTGGTTYFYVATSFSAACPATPTCGESANSNQVTATIPSP